MKLPAVILIDPKYPRNVAGVLRACASWEIPTLRWTGDRVRLDNPGERLPREERMRSYRTVDFRRVERPFDELPKPCTPVAVEFRQSSESLFVFDHPPDPQGVYVFGPEDGHLPPAVLGLCHRFVIIPSKHCLNLAAAVNVILYDKRFKESQ